MIQFLNIFLKQVTKNFILAICVFGLISSSNLAKAQTINFKNFTVLDGLANSTVYCTIQDSKGFLWIATSSGVNRFDGKTFETFTTDNGLADNEVLQLFEDSKGRIWFLNFNGKLGYYYNGTFHKPENDALLEKTITKASIINCFEDSSKTLWFSTNQQQIISIKGNEVRFYTRPNEILDISNSFIFEDTKHQIIAVNHKGFYKIGSKMISQEPAEFLPIFFQSNTFNKKTGKLRFIAKEGLVEYLNGKLTLLRKIPEELTLQVVNSFLLYKNELWLSSGNGGVYIINKSGKISGHLLKDKTVSHFLLDKDENIWVSSLGGGLTILPKNTGNVIQYTQKTGLPENAIWSVTKDKYGKIWLGSITGLITFIDSNNIFTRDFNIYHHPFNPIKKLNVDKARNSVWFASSYSLGEINMDNPSGEVRYLKEKSGLDFSMKSFSLGSNNQIAFSLASGVYILKDKSKPLVFDTRANNQDQVFFADRSFKIFYDSKDRLWFSNINGLFRYDNGKVDTMSKYSNLLSKRVTDIIELPDGKMVIGTYGYGVIVMDNAHHIRSISIRDGLNSNICRKLVYDGHYIWLTTFSGVDKFDYHDVKNTIRTYKIKEGLTSDEVLDIYIDENKIYLGTNGGLTIFPRNITAINYSPPPFYFTSFQVNGKKIKINSGHIFNYDQNNITVKFTSINFTQADEAYQYRLKNDAPWIETTNTNIDFGSLEPGKYNLAVRAKLQNSNWGIPKYLGFEIVPAYWQTWWFLAIIFFLISLAIIGLVYMYFVRQRKLETEKINVQSKILALEQKALQAMMNPHFVFNIMNSIQYFINTEDAARANEVLTGFAKLIRKNLEICTKTYISLDEELIYLKLYLSLEKLRFGDKMTYDILVDESIDTEETQIPTMLLQPFIENAIWHGIMPQKDGGHITIEIKDKDTELLVLIVDDGQGIQNSKKLKTSDHVSLGMQITQDRVNLLNLNSDENISISTNQTGDFGTKVTIKIPI
ncbi:MAG: two-component regulator propeller domain-containing protein [Daejeonella sp.]